MKTETQSPLVPSLLFIGVLLIAVWMTVHPLTLHAPSPPQGPPGVTGGDEAALRLALARFLDVRYCEGDTVTGERATIAHVRRYVLILAAVAVVTWGIAHAVSWLR